jgi:hypothetical protein
MLCLAGGLSVAGCTSYGSYTVGWKFVGGEEANTGCGQHGVASIRVIGSSTEGEREDVVAVCADGGLTHSVPVGTWTFSVHQFDVRGRQIDMADENGNPVAPTAGAVIAEDATVELDLVELTPRPKCSDGVDNDVDGRVDLDDAQCAGDRNGTAE